MPGLVARYKSGDRLGVLRTFDGELLLDLQGVQ
jgi:hypothetical protein